MDLTQAQEAALVHLYKSGDDAPANIAEASGFHRNSISRVLPDLEERGLVESKGAGVWTLTAAGLTAARRLLEDD